MPVVRNMTSVAVRRTNLHGERFGGWLAIVLTVWFALWLNPETQAAGPTDRLAVLLKQH